MADQILDTIRDYAEGQIDFQGQKLAEVLATLLLGLSGLVAFVIGYIQQDITFALYIGIAGAALTALVVVPPWPFFNRHPIRWLPVDGKGGAKAISNQITVDGKQVN